MTPDEKATVLEILKTTLLAAHDLALASGVRRSALGAITGAAAEVCGGAKGCPRQHDYSGLRGGVGRRCKVTPRGRSSVSRWS